MGDIQSPQYRDTGSYSSYGTLTVRIPQERIG